MRISDWSSDVCSSDLIAGGFRLRWSISRAKVGFGVVSGRYSIYLRHPGLDPGSRFLRHRPTSASSGTPDQVRGDRKSVVSGKSVSVRVDLGGRRLLKKKK